MPKTKPILNQRTKHYAKPLTREKIANAAIDIVQQEGPKALSMRKIANLFDVDVAALYRHYRNKDALIEAIGLMVSAEIVLERPSKGSWEKRMLALTEQIRNRMVNHPELGIYGGGSQWSTPFFAKANGLIAELFADAGLKGEQLLFATQTVLHLVISISQSEAMTRATNAEQNRAFAETVSDQLPESARQVWPSAKAQHQWSINFERFFNAAIKSTLAGLLSETKRNSDRYR